MQKVKILFEDLSINSEYQLLEEGKNDDELKEIAAKKGLKVPSRDLSIFKCTYAMVDKENKNKCTLPRKEVKKALSTLTGKAIDKDHLRKNTIGYWLQGELDDNDIIAYGAFWKSNFPDDYEEIKDRMSKGKMKISFEAWGERNFKENGSYELTDIEFAGGALLFDTKPAFPDAEVMEFSNKTLEFAKFIEEDKKLINQEGEIAMEEARLNFNWDNETIARMMYETECPTCKTKGWNDILNIDFENSKVKSKCPACQGVSEYNLTPSASIIKKGKKPTMAQENKVKKEGGSEVMEKFLKKYNKSSADELISFLDSEIETAKQTLGTKDQEITILKADKDSLTKTVEESKLLIENSKLETEKVKTEYATVKTKLDKRLSEEKANAVKSRKDVLGEFAKDLSDEDILNDLKFENAKLKKELAEAKLKPAGGSLDGGAASVQDDNNVVTKRNTIQAKAWKETKDK
jgi:hypothetical protein